MTAEVYVILGGGGAFGIHCAKFLLERQSTECVWGVGRAPLRPEPFRLGITDDDDYGYKSFHTTHELDLLLRWLEVLRPDVIVNFAAQGEGAASWRDSWRFFETNAMGLSRLHEEISARPWGRACHFIHISSSEVYGSVEAAASEDAAIRPSSPYSASKAAFDLYLLSLMQQGRGMPTTILRPSNCYCSGQLLHRIIPRSIVSGLLGLSVPLHGGGAARKSYLHARDLASAIHACARASQSRGKLYNVGPESPTSIREVAERCARSLGVEFGELFDLAPERLGQDACYWLDSSRIRDELGWRPEIDWDDGLGEVVAWAQANLQALANESFDYHLRA